MDSIVPGKAKSNHSLPGLATNDRRNTGTLNTDRCGLYRLRWLQCLLDLEICVMSLKRDVYMQGTLPKTARLMQTAGMVLVNQFKFLGQSVAKLNGPRMLPFHKTGKGKVEPN